MSGRSRDKLLLLALEPSYGASVTPDASNYIRAISPQITFEGETVEDEVEQGFEGLVEQIPVGEHVTLTFGTHWFGSGTKGVAPVLRNLFLCSRFAEVVETDARVRYVLAADQGGSAAASFWVGKNRHTITGIRGRPELVVENRVWRLNWTCKGTYAAPTHDVAPKPSITQAPWLNYQPTGPGRTSNAILHGQAIKPYSWSVNTGNEPVYDESLVDSQILFNGREPTGSITCEALPLDTINYFERASNRQHGEMSIQQGQAAGNICKLVAPRVQIGKPTYSNLDNGNIGYDIATRLLVNNGNDEYEFIFE